MGLFKHKKVGQHTNLKQEAMASKIADAIIARQYKMAKWLNKKASKLGTARTLAILVFLALALAGYCVCLIASAI